MTPNRINFRRQRGGTRRLYNAGQPEAKTLDSQGDAQCYTALEWVDKVVQIHHA